MLSNIIWFLRCPTNKILLRDHVKPLQIAVCASFITLWLMNGLLSCHSYNCTTRLNIYCIPKNVHTVSSLSCFVNLTQVIKLQSFPFYWNMKWCSMKTLLKIQISAVLELLTVVDFKCIFNDLNSSPLDILTAISQTMYSDAFSWMESFVLWLTFHLSFFPKGPIYNKPASV